MNANTTPTQLPLFSGGSSVKRSAAPEEECCSCQEAWLCQAIAPTPSQPLPEADTLCYAPF